MLVTQYPIILASKSPRRSEILHNAGFEFEVKVQDFNEKTPVELHEEATALFIANSKLSQLQANVANNIVICADTVVVLSSGRLGKPKDKKEAKSMLQQLSNSTHRVLTGVSIGTPKGKIEILDSTAVTFKEIEDWEIDFYIENYQPFDKAGSYGIQDFIGMNCISHIEGSYYNVMGLPIHRVYDALKPFILR